MDTLGLEHDWLSDDDGRAPTPPAPTLAPGRWVAVPWTALARLTTAARPDASYMDSAPAMISAANALVAAAHPLPDADVPGERVTVDANELQALRDANVQWRRYGDVGQVVAASLSDATFALIATARPLLPAAPVAAMSEAEARALVDDYERAVTLLRSQGATPPEGYDRRQRRADRRARLIAALTAPQPAPVAVDRAAVEAALDELREAVFDAGYRCGDMDGPVLPPDEGEDAARANLLALVFPAAPDAVDAARAARAARAALLDAHAAMVQAARAGAMTLHVLFAAQKALEAVPRLLLTMGAAAIPEAIRICREAQSEAQIKGAVKGEEDAHAAEVADDAGGGR